MSNKESGMYSFDETIISDLHKEAHGFRPSTYWWQVWHESTDDQKQGTWDDLIHQLNLSIEQERRAHVRATERFEQLVAKTIEHGAGDRETALRWIMDASDCRGDWDYLCWQHGLPYGFFNKRDEIARVDALQLWLHTQRDASLQQVQPIVCKNGLTMSVQASKYHYCKPRSNVGPWTHVEIGYPSKCIPELEQYADTPTDAVYACVPVTLVAKIIEDNGGFMGKREAV